MSVSDMFWAAPPIARTLTAACVLLSVPTWLGIIDPTFSFFATSRVFTISRLPEPWRLITTFILSSPKWGLVMDPYFLYTYCTNLETTAMRFRGPGDFAFYLLFCCVTILLLGGVYLQGVMLLSPLTLALAYTYAQENPEMRLNYFVVTFAAKWLPLAMLAMTCVMASPGAAILQATGLVAAHAYDFLTQIWPEHGAGTRILQTPQILQQLFAQPGGAPQQRGAGTAFAARSAAGAQNVPQNQAGRGAGRASGFSGGNWGERGQGRRLG